MTPARPLTPLEVDTLRVALALLLGTSSQSLDLLDARVQTAVSTIANDQHIARLLAELDGAGVDIRKGGP